MNLCNVLKGSALVRKILSMKAAEEDGKTQTEIEPVSYRRFINLILTSVSCFGCRLLGPTVL